MAAQPILVGPAEQAARLRLHRRAYHGWQRRAHGPAAASSTGRLHVEVRLLQGLGGLAHRLEDGGVGAGRVQRIPLVLECCQGAVDLLQLLLVVLFPLEGLQGYPLVRLGVLACCCCLLLGALHLVKNLFGAPPFSN